MTIPTADILSKHLCLVCARDGIERPVQEHEHNHAHFQLTLYELENFPEMDLEGFDPEDHAPLAFVDDADLLSYAIDVGGFRAFKTFDPEKPIKYYTRHPGWAYDTPREAILRAKMEQLWDGLAGEGESE